MYEFQSKRIKKLQSIIKKNNLDAFLITNLKNIFYISGFSGSSGALILTCNEVFLITDGRYKEQSKKECNKDIEILIYENISLFSYITKVLSVCNFNKVAYESDDLSVSNLLSLKNEDHYKLYPYSFVVEHLRYTKDPYEISVIKKGVEITKKVFFETLNYIKEGRSEIDISIYMNALIRKLGASGSSFEVIVASGENGSYPHFKPTYKKVKKGELVTIDFGVIYNNYSTDITRTISIGKLENPKLVDIYNTVYNANKLAISEISVFKEFSQIDFVARDYINKKGYGQYFNHGLGHGLGLDVHEYPSINKTNNSKVNENTLLTIEPGIYIPNFGGVRIEDMVLTDGKDNIVLTDDIKKEIIEI